MKILISDLKEYPWNSNVYGEHTSELQSKEMNELVADISLHGILVKPVIDQNGYVIAGNRRIKALTILGQEYVDVEQWDFVDEMQRIVYLFSSNQYRTKTTEVKTREAMYLKTAHKKYAEAMRRQKTDPDYVFDDETFRNLVGKDSAALIAPMPERTLRRSEKVINKLDELDSAGKDDEAKDLRDALETSIVGAERIVDNMNDLDELKTVDTKPKISKPDPNDYDEDLYWYWKDMEKMTKQIRTAVSKLKNSGRFNHTMPLSLNWIISNISKVNEKFETWDPRKLGTCEACDGSGMQEGTDLACGHCINGRTGYYTTSPTGETNGEDSSSDDSGDRTEPGQSDTERSSEDGNESED